MAADDDLQPPIAEHALLGDGHTAALVSRYGTIDWLPWPDFDSPSIFGSLLDARRGGAFRLSARGPGASRRRYLPGTNVLETHVDTPTGAARLIDFLAVEPEKRRGRVGRRRALVRLLRGASGRTDLDMVCAPRTDYGRRVPRFARRSDRAVEIDDENCHLVLTASVPIRIEEGRLVASLEVGEREEGWVILSDAGHVPTRGGHILLEETVEFWRSWISRLEYDGPYREHVERSALALKALMYSPTGAIVAAPTTSLPEEPGGSRNWDYRFSWLRDATMTLGALHGVGYHDEAAAYFRWLFETAKLDHPSQLQVLYGIRGEHQVPERVLPHLSGYRGAKPVRIGNAAAKQLQLDVFGELVDAFWTFRDLMEEEPPEWREVCYGAVDWVAQHWREPDEGIWEVRSGRHQFVHSKAMCWVALDRGVKLLGGKGAQAAAWARERDAVRKEVLKRGYDARRGTFVQAYDHPVLDASLLRLALIGFLPAYDPRIVRTVDAIRRQLGEYGLIRRYPKGSDGLHGGEATFALCTFWLIENLALQKRLVEADELLRIMLSYGNDVGLFAEEIDPRVSRQWGNFPQAFTHLGLLRATTLIAKNGVIDEEKPMAR